MKRQLLVLTGPKEFDVVYGKPTDMAEIRKDHIGAKGNLTFEANIDGPSLMIKSLDVAWEAENEALGDNDGTDGLQTLIRRAIILGARNHNEVLRAFRAQEKVRKKNLVESD